MIKMYEQCKEKKLKTGVVFPSVNFLLVCIHICVFVCVCDCMRVFVPIDALSLIEELITSNCQQRNRKKEKKIFF